MAVGSVKISLTTQSLWSPFVLVRLAGRTRTLSPLRTGRWGNSTVSGRCRSKFRPKARRDKRALNSRSNLPHLRELGLDLTD